MSPTTYGLLIGGLVPAFLFGLSGVLQKVSAQYNLGSGMFLVFAGLAIVIIGAIVTEISGDRTFNLAGATAAFSMGVCWALGVGAVVYALLVYQTPLSKLVPLYNINTLVAVVLSLVFFAEHQGLSVLKLLLGAILIVIGGVLAAGA